MPTSESAPPEPPKPKRTPKPCKTASPVAPVPLSRWLRHYRQRRTGRRKAGIAPAPAIATGQREYAPEIKRIVEALLFAAKQPLTIKQLQQLFPELQQPPLADIQQAVVVLGDEYRSRPIELKQVASGFRFQIRAELSPWVARLFEEKPPKYSRALLETLAIIAYRQPVTRGDIEDIRGVGVSSTIIQTLMEREWVKVVGHKEVPGRPALLGTTPQFLDYFNKTSLNELPTLPQLDLPAEGAATSQGET